MLKMHKPLDGIVVFDITTNVAGPLATQILADLGADVVKVESPRGDPARGIMPARPRNPGLASYFVPYNRGKTDIILDLKDPQDYIRAAEYVDKADVFVQNSRPGAMERLGLGPDLVQSRNPRCIYASLSGYNPNGDSPDRPGVDMIIQAESGATTGLLDPDGRPQTPGFQLVDHAAGHVLAEAILAALIHRQRNGVADRITVSLYDVAVSLQANHITQALNSTLTAGVDPNSRPAANLTVSPSSIYAAADGFLVLSAYLPHHWERLTQLLANDSLTNDARFATRELRAEHDTELRDALENVLRTNTVDHWLSLLGQAGIMVAPVSTHRDVIESQCFRDADLTITVDNDGTDVATVRTPAQYASFRAIADRRVASADRSFTRS